MDTPLTTVEAPPLAPGAEARPAIIVIGLDDWVTIRRALKAYIDECERNAQSCRQHHVEGVAVWEGAKADALDAYDRVRLGALR